MRCGRVCEGVCLSDGAFDCGVLALGGRYQMKACGFLDFLIYEHDF